MQITTAKSAGTVLFFVCTISATYAAGFSSEEPNVEPEIVNIRTLSMFPAETGSRVSMPVPYQPALQANDFVVI